VLRAWPFCCAWLGQRATVAHVFAPAPDLLKLYRENFILKLQLAPSTSHGVLIPLRHNAILERHMPRFSVIEPKDDLRLSGLVIFGFVSVFSSNYV
jgi:hypothetical protein